MKARYLLPCSCGAEIPIEPSQAGQVVVCACGAELEVPTLLRMSALKRVPESEPATAKAPARWGLRQRLMLGGAVIAVLFLALAIWGYMGRPRSEMVFTYRSLDSLSYTGVWQIWQDLRQQGVSRRATEAEANFGLSMKYFHLWMGFFLGMAALGILVMLSGFLVPPPRARSQAGGAGRR